MAAPEITPRTPITSRVDRTDGRIRLIEEAVLLVRGEWPAVACGLCETVNRAAGLIIATPNELDEVIQRAAEEAMRVVEGLYGHDAALEVRRLAALAQDPEAASAARGARRRVRFPSRRHRLVRTRAGH